MPEEKVVEDEVVDVTEDATGDNSGQNDKKTFTPEQQAVVDKIIAKRLERARATWDTEAQAAQAKAKEEAEKERLEKQAEWEKLAKAHESKVNELEPVVSTLSEQIKAYSETVGKLLEAKLEALGEGARVAVDNLPGEPDELAKLKWLEANDKLFRQDSKKKGTPLRKSLQHLGINNPKEMATRPIINF